MWSTSVEGAPLQWVRMVQVGSRWRMVWRMVGQLGGSGVVRQPCDMVGGCFYWWGVGLLGWVFVVLVFVSLVAMS